MFPTASVLAMLLLLPSQADQTAPQDFFDAASRFFGEYVDAGSVRYASLVADPEPLEELTRLIESTELEEIPDDETRKAYLINVYNLLVIRTVVEHYPIESPLDVPGFFGSVGQPLGGRNVTLDEIEKEILFGIDQDPRLHFAVVCAAVGCPEIVPFAYRPGALERQLDRRAEEVLNDPRWVRVDEATGTVHLSEIFDWYSDDFLQRHDGVIDYINEYRYEPIPSAFSREFTEYDWRLNDALPSSEGIRNLRGFTPAVLLRPGQYEVKVFNNLYTQTAFFDDDRERQDQGSRSTFFTSLVSFIYGLSPDLNLGLEFWVRSVRNDAPDSSPFALFRFDGAPDGRTTLTRIGPKVKFAPFREGSLRSFSIQSTLLLAVPGDLTGVTDDEPYLDDDAHIWLNQLFYDRGLGRRASLFAEIDTWVRIDRDLAGDRNRLDVPFKLFLSAYPSDRITLYATHEVNLSWDGDGTDFYNQAGVGAKYQIVPELELEALVTTFYTGKNSGAGRTYNLGLRFVNL